MSQYAILQNNVVINVCAWDGVSPYAPPTGCTLVQSDSCGIGDIYDPLTQTFSKPAGS